MRYYARRVARTLILSMFAVAHALSAQAPAPAPAPAAPTAVMTLANILPDAKAALEAALDAYQAGDVTTALGHASRALAADSTLGLARSLLAILRGGPTAAAESRRAVVDAAGRPAGELSWVVANRFAGTDRAAMLAAARTVLAADRRLAFEHANSLGGTVRLDSLRALAARYPDFVAPRLWIAGVRSTAVFPMPSPEAFDEGLRMGQEAVRLAPNLSISHTILGQVYERQARHADALPHLNQATALNPKDENAHALKAEIFVRENKPEEARTSLDSAIAGTPHLGRRVTYRQSRAVLFLYDGKVPEMMDALAATARDAEANGQGPVAAGVHWTMAIVSAGTRDGAAYETHMSEARRLNLAPETVADAEVISNFLLMNAAQARRALGDYVRLTEAQPPVVRAQNVHRMTGLTLVAEGKPAEAIPELKQGGPNPYAQLGLIEAFTALKQPRQADSVRTAMFTQKDISYVSTARPIAKFRAPNPTKK